jgi:glucose uptake protein
MFIVEAYPLAIAMCLITMLCWGSWANTQKLASKEWRFQLFYWDYAIGVFLLALLLAFTLGSSGAGGRSFMADLQQADSQWLGSAFLGGVIFNLSNILLVAAIDIAGMAVAFPVGVGLALVLGVITTYLSTKVGNVPMLGLGVAAVMVAIVLDALAYKRLASGGQKTPVKGIVISVAAGVLMGFFYKYVAQAMGQIEPITKTLEAGKYGHRAVQRRAVALESAVEQRHDDQALYRAPGGVWRLFYQRQSPAPSGRDPGRDDLERRHVF